MIDNIIPNSSLFWIAHPDSLSTYVSYCDILCCINATKHHKLSNICCRRPIQRDSLQKPEWRGGPSLAWLLRTRNSPNSMRSTLKTLGREQMARCAYTCLFHEYRLDNWGLSFWWHGKIDPKVELQGQQTAIHVDGVCSYSIMDGSLPTLLLCDWTTMLLPHNKDINSNKGPVQCCTPFGESACDHIYYVASPSVQNGNFHVALPSPLSRVKYCQMKPTILATKTLTSFHTMLASHSLIGKGLCTIHEFWFEK